MKILITGAEGFSSRHLINLLNQQSEIRLYFTDLKIGNKGNWYECDLTEYPSVYRMIKDIKPDQIYNLAGTFSNNYEIDYKVNVLTVKNILDSLIKLELNSRVLLIGSAAEYGLVSEEDNPVKENHDLNPVSIYGLTKVYQTHLMRYYYSIYGMDIVMARPFNLMGRGISKKLFIGRLYEQIDEYRQGKISKIVLGNVNNKRDYIDVKEAVKYYEVMMKYGCSGEIYNVGSGESVKIYDLLKMILKKNDLDMSVVEKKIINHTNKFDVEEIYADISKLNNIIY